MRKFLLVAIVIVCLIVLFFWAKGFIQHFSALKTAVGQDKVGTIFQKNWQEFKKSFQKFKQESGSIPSFTNQPSSELPESNTILTNQNVNLIKDYNNEIQKEITNQ